MKRFQNYQVLAFDFDETLATLDVPWGRARSELQMMLQQEFGFDSKGLMLHQSIDVAQEAYGLEVKDNVRAILYGYESVAAYTVNVALVEKLKALRKPVAIYSNNCHEVVKKVVCEIGLGEIVELVIAYEDVPQFKPHPAGMEMLLKHFSLSPEEILYVGDKDTDRQVAEACGVPFYFVQELV